MLSSGLASLCAHPFALGSDNLSQRSTCLPRSEIPSLRGLLPVEALPVGAGPPASSCVPCPVWRVSHQPSGPGGETQPHQEGAARPCTLRQPQHRSSPALRPSPSLVSSPAPGTPAPTPGASGSSHHRVLIGPCTCLHLGHLSPPQTDLPDSVRAELTLRDHCVLDRNQIKKPPTCVLTVSALTPAQGGAAAGSCARTPPRVLTPESVLLSHQGRAPQRGSVSAHVKCTAFVLGGIGLSSKASILTVTLSKLLTLLKPPLAHPQNDTHDSWRPITVKKSRDFEDKGLSLGKCQPAL